MIILYLETLWEENFHFCTFTSYEAIYPTDPE